MYTLTVSSVGKGFYQPQGYKGKDIKPSENRLYLYQFSITSSQYNAVCCKSLICFVSYTITSDFKTVKLVFSTMCFPEMDCATGCSPPLNVLLNTSCWYTSIKFKSLQILWCSRFELTLFVNTTSLHNANLLIIIWLSSTMPKATGKARKVDGKTTKGNTTSGKPTFGGCKGCTRELSEALYKRHAKFRELDEANNRNVDARDLASPQQANGTGDMTSWSRALIDRFRRHVVYLRAILPRPPRACNLLQTPATCPLTSNRANMISL